LSWLRLKGGALTDACVCDALDLTRPMTGRHEVRRRTGAAQLQSPEQRGWRSVSWATVEPQLALFATFQHRSLVLFVCACVSPHCLSRFVRTPHSHQRCAELRFQRGPRPACLLPPPTMNTPPRRKRAVAGNAVADIRSSSNSASVAKRSKASKATVKVSAGCSCGEAC
jgi:hypothetical protein